MVTFFDETHARTIGLRIAAEGHLLHPALRIHRSGDADRGGLFGHRHGGDTGCDRLSADRPLLPSHRACGCAGGGSFFGAYLSYFLDGATGGIIVVLQTLIFLLAFVFAPTHGVLAARAAAALVQEGGA